MDLTLCNHHSSAITRDVTIGVNNPCKDLQTGVTIIDQILDGDVLVLHEIILCELLLERSTSLLTRCRCATDAICIFTSLVNCGIILSCPFFQVINNLRILLTIARNSISCMESITKPETKHIWINLNITIFPLHALATKASDAQLAC